MPTFVDARSGQNTLKLYHTNHTVETLTGSLPGGIATTSISKVGQKMPHWRQKIKACVDATTPFTATIVSDFLTEGQINADGKVLTVESGFDRVIPFKEYWVGPFLGNPRLVPPPDTGVGGNDTQARIDFLQRVRSSRTSFQSGVFLGELKEAIHMVVRPASALREAVNTYVRTAKKAARGVRGRKAVAKAISGTWLEHSYGWRPLFSDVDSAMKALAKQPHLVPTVVSSTARSEYHSEPVVQTNIAPGSSQIKNLRRHVIRYKNSVRYKGAVAWSSTNLAADWKSNWGLELREFSPTVWELIPYSFLVDYFTNFGNLVNASSVGTVSLRWGYRTIRNLASTCVVGSTWTSANTNVKQLSVSEGISWPTPTRLNLTRSPVASVGVSVMDLQFRIPGVDSLKWLNIAALATQKRL